MLLRRNDPCWCRSGKKYKRCHLYREKAKPISRQDALTRLKTARDKKYCLHAEAGATTCRGPIVQAHTIPRSCLDLIAEGGHVSHLGIEIFPRAKTGTLVPLVSVGLDDASTFTGFCQHHDNDTFAPIETSPFQSKEQHAFLVGYRNLCRELFLKRIHADVATDLREADRGKPVVRQVNLQAAVSRYQEGVNAGVRDLERHKRAFDRALRTGEYSKVRFYVLRFMPLPEIMCSGAFLPECDFQGNEIQDISDISSPGDFLTYSLFATAGGSVAVFAWMQESRGACTRFLSSLHALDDQQMPHAIVRFTFEFHENTYFSRKWWDGLDVRAKERLKQRAQTGRFETPSRSLHALEDDGLRLVSWTLANRETNLALS